MVKTGACVPFPSLPVRQWACCGEFPFEGPWRKNKEMQTVWDLLPYSYFLAKILHICLIGVLFEKAGL